MFFIHKFQEGTMVKFVSTPQVRHTQIQPQEKIKIGSYVRSIRGRIAKIKGVYTKNIDTSKYPDSVRYERVHIYSLMFLDNKETVEVELSLSISLVLVRPEDLFLYNLYLFFKNRCSKIIKKWLVKWQAFKKAT